MVKQDNNIFIAHTAALPLKSYHQISYRDADGILSGVYITP